MNLNLGKHHAVGYTSQSQIARRLTEQWASENLFCAACPSNSIQRTKCNTPALDFTCPNCEAAYELKAGRTWNERRIPDAGYDAMLRAINADKTPNLLVLHYTPELKVNNLLLVPRFFFTASCVEKRKPLSPTARRAGWVGCNILLSAIPIDGKLRLIKDGSITSPSIIRNQYSNLLPIASITTTMRGWTLDVLRIIQAIPRMQFTLSEVYSHEQQLAVLHPENRNIRPKIRQQLQVLRDIDFIEFSGSGTYRKVNAVQSE